jgi:hypothetical protein
MTAILRPFKRLFTPVHPIPAGIYHYQSPPDDPRNYRLHLRLEEHGSGVLIINATVVLHLNQTAAEYAYYLVKNVPADEVARQMAARYQVQPDQARRDYELLSERIQTLATTQDVDPVLYLDFERQKPFSGEISAPYRLDCALTYRLPEDQPVEAAPIERVARELTTDEWCSILDKAWQAGVPHVIFTGGEPTLRDDLPALVAHAEQLGQVSGLLTGGLRLADEIYLGKLLQAGLDHLLLVLQPENEQSWQAVGNALVEDLYVVVHITVTNDDRQQITTIIQRLANMGVQHISLSASDAAYVDALHFARQKVAVANLDLVWNLPTPYSALHPVALESEDAKIEGAGRAWLYVEPDGDVRPAQGDPRILGNLLRDNFAQIFGKQAAPA